MEELEGMDAWTKTMVALRVLTAFKKRRTKRMEEEKEKAMKERSKNLWRQVAKNNKVLSENYCVIKLRVCNQDKC